MPDVVKRPYWYKTYWCQVCGREERERIYGTKPADPDKRAVTMYCGCLDSSFA